MPFISNVSNLYSHLTLCLEKRKNDVAIERESKDWHSLKNTEKVRSHWCFSKEEKRRRISNKYYTRNDIVNRSDKTAKRKEEDCPKGAGRKNGRRYKEVINQNLLSNNLA